jgi:hypothetical protein
MRTLSPHRRSCAPFACRDAARDVVLHTLTQVVLLAFAVSMAWAPLAGAQCIIVRERTPQYLPHLAMHFGEPQDVPRHVECASSLDKSLPTLCVPIYAYNLWEGSTEFSFAVRTPNAPVGFDRGPAIMQVMMNIDEHPDGATTSLHLVTASPTCGPLLLGCLRITTAALPDLFEITVAPHAMSGLAAARTPSGEWRSFVVDQGGAHIGTTATCPATPCDLNASVHDLQATAGDQTGFVSFSWASGSGNFTMLRFRVDGQYPVDPWDGQMLAFLPSEVTSYTHRFMDSGDLRVTAFSITRGPFGNLYSASNVECGSLTSALVHLPVGVAPSSWGTVKTLYR